MQSLSVIIPAYNAAKTIIKTVAAAAKFLKEKKIDYEIIVVDDGSRDNTRELLNTVSDSRIRILVNQNNRGKGFSIKRGVTETTKDCILMTDADGAVPIETLENFLPHLNYDIIIGSKALQSSKPLTRYPRHRRCGTFMLNFLTRLFLVKGITDTQCGFKILRAETAKKIFPKQTINRFGFDIEILYLAQKYGYRIKEIPVHWSHNPDSRVKPIRDGLEILVDLIKIKINEFKKIYD